MAQSKAHTVRELFRIRQKERMGGFYITLSTGGSAHTKRLSQVELSHSILLFFSLSLHFPFLPDQVQIRHTRNSSNCLFNAKIKGLIFFSSLKASPTERVALIKRQIHVDIGPKDPSTCPPRKQTSTKRKRKRQGGETGVHRGEELSPIPAEA